MTFVFTSWYFVILALIAGIVACLLVFFKMDKTDKAMIKEFVEDSQTNNADNEAIETVTPKTE